MNTTNSPNVLQKFEEPGYFFRGENEPAGCFDPESIGQDEVEVFNAKKIRCQVCNAGVTTTHDKFEKNGRHEHGFFNPHGIAFIVGCFKKAAGCSIQGEPSAEFSWFRGYTWSLALCRNCGEHLGWCFQGRGGENFFGLILTKLKEDP